MKVKPIHVQNIQLWLISDGIFEPISCSKENVSLRPGHNSIRLMFEVLMTYAIVKVHVSCRVQVFPCSGTFNPTKLDLVFGKLVLQYDLSKNNQPSFVVNENVSDLSVEVETPSSGKYPSNISFFH